MKCNNCGREFGSSITCQYCGIDRVVGLAEYPNGTFPAGTKSRKARDTIQPDGKKEQPSISTTKQTLSAEPLMLCWHCQNVIPGDSDFCPACGTPLYHICPKCGHKYSAQYEHCNKCGTNRERYLIQIEKEKEQKQREEQQRLLDEEKAAYDMAITENNELLLRQFIEKYPYNHNISRVKSHLDKILEAKEKAAWEDATKKNTLYSYREFISNYPKGKHFIEAQNKYLEMKKKEDEEKHLNNIVKAIFIPIIAIFTFLVIKISIDAGEIFGAVVLLLIGVGLIIAMLQNRL